ncbi:SDR family NAD(P)-dependent oxidoreductase [Dyadobacter jiangsuensis]|uniref:Cyclopentanol dehydrogenase n=1 Tax=Dyadobacter jiangsuensis TaxID=1591085 RepID=A0A2P8FA32_9BACT|nr:glucose 1-dehydrogenase [Dyadobacter jiangsuensis]PSL18584.1 cyclopentanol dehydrogenase [Dyadobacter jiangsuensis]
MARLENKVAIITGAAGGMGEAEARLFAAEGAKVLLTDIDEKALKAVVEQITSQGQTAASMIQDVSSESGWAEVTARASELFGKIDVLVNNAGVTGNLLAPFEERTLEEFNKVLSVNLVSQFLGTKAVLPYLKNNGGGSIINISSIGGIIGSAGATAYTASKGGSRAFTKGAAVELAKYNIRVNSVHPGYVETPMTTQMKGAGDFAKMAIGATPLGRGGYLNEIAYAVLYLASDESTFTTGAEFVIDGGATAL